MRKVLCFFFCLLVCTFPTAAETFAPTEDSNYIHLYDLGYPMELLCKAIGADLVYIEDGKRIEAQFHDGVLEKLLEYQEENGLYPSGEFDPDTLRCILELSAPDFGNLLVWIPMHGGIKYHTKPTCSKMYESRQMPVDCAYQLNYSSCGKCKTDIQLHRYGWHPD